MKHSNACEGPTPASTVGKLTAEKALEYLPDDDVRRLAALMVVPRPVIEASLQIFPFGSGSFYQSLCIADRSEENEHGYYELELTRLAWT